MTEELKEILGQLNTQVFGPDSRLRLEWVDFAQLREQEVNANAMPAEMFNALVGNIQKHQHLESVPLCARRTGSDVTEIVSGHHRIRAGIKAGKKGTLALVYDGLTKSEIIAKQLSHNSIQGNSDPELVALLFEQIEDVDAQIESYIDPSDLTELPAPVPIDTADLDLGLDVVTVAIVFLPTQIEKVEELVAELGLDADEVHLADRASFKKFREVMHGLKMDMKVLSRAAAVAKMAELALERLQQIRAEAEAQQATEPKKGVKK